MFKGKIDVILCKLIYRDLAGYVFDVPAEGYDELYGEEQIRKYAVVFNLFSKDFKNILDVGCATGLLTDYLKYIGFREEYIGLDKDFERVKYAKKKRSGEYVVGDAHHLPFRDKCVDLTVCFTVIHLLELNKVVQEIVRVSRSFTVITLLKKRIDLKEKLLNILKNVGRVRELEDKYSADQIFLVELQKD